MRRQLETEETGLKKGKWRMQSPIACIVHREGDPYYRDSGRGRYRVKVRNSTVPLLPSRARVQAWAETHQFGRHVSSRFAQSSILQCQLCLLLLQRDVILCLRVILLIIKAIHRCFLRVMPSQ